MRSLTKEREGIEDEANFGSEACDELVLRDEEASSP